MSIPVRAESEIHPLVRAVWKKDNDSANPSLLWAFCGLVGIMPTLGFAVLNKIREARAPALEPAATD